MAARCRNDQRRFTGDSLIKGIVGCGIAGVKGNQDIQRFRRLPLTNCSLFKAKILEAALPGDAICLLDQVRTDFDTHDLGIYPALPE